MRTLGLTEALEEIRRTAALNRWPFFFLAGAGVSLPSLPSAQGIVDLCKARCPEAVPPESLSTMSEYSWWFEKAWPSPADRQQFLRNIMKDQPVTEAHLSLAQLLIDRRISNLAVTTNFDDLLSRALDLFGASHIVSDHPATIHRINPFAEDIQIVHVHGSYWHYDACNLTGEIRSHARKPQSSTFSTRQFLEQLLNARSPLIIGYSGWDGDVFMQALKARLTTGLAYKVYWFCYDAGQADHLWRSS
jgi:hypothetical protein